MELKNLETQEQTEKVRKILDTLEPLLKKSKEEVREALAIISPHKLNSDFLRIISIGQRYPEIPLHFIKTITGEYYDPMSHEIALFLIALKQIGNDTVYRFFANSFTGMVNWQQKSFYDHLKVIAENELADFEKRKPAIIMLQAMDLAYLAMLELYESKRYLIPPKNQQKSIFQSMDGADLFRGNYIQMEEKFKSEINTD